MNKDIQIIKNDNEIVKKDIQNTLEIFKFK
jgi:hypothetical protein